MTRSGRRTASALSGSKSSVRSDEGGPKQQPSQETDEGPTDEIKHVACPSALSAPFLEGAIRPVEAAPYVRYGRTPLLLVGAFSLPSAPIAPIALPTPQ
jgi:hypothetical protein